MAGEMNKVSTMLKWRLGMGGWFIVLHGITGNVP